MKRFVALLVIITSILVLTLSGCSISRKPAPKPSQPQQDRNIQTPLPRRDPGVDIAPRENKREQTLASKLARTAESVDGVKAATVVVSGSTAFVGLEVESDVDKSEVDKVKADTVEVVKRTDSSIKAVNVTTDPNLITRLKKIAQGIEKGKPVSSFAEELEELARRISPKSNLNKGVS